MHTYRQTTPPKAYADVLLRAVSRTSAYIHLCPEGFAAEEHCHLPSTCPIQTECFSQPFYCILHLDPDASRYVDACGGCRFRQPTCLQNQVFQTYIVYRYVPGALHCREWSVRLFRSVSPAMYNTHVAAESSGRVPLHQCPVKLHLQYRGSGPRFRGKSPPGSQACTSPRQASS